MLNFLEELVNNLIFFLDIPYHWRFYVCVAAGFSMMLSLRHFISKGEAEANLPLIVLGCWIIPAIIGFIWDKVAHRDEDDS